MDKEERKKDEAIISRIERLEQLVRSLLNGKNFSPRKVSLNPPIPATTSLGRPDEQQQTRLDPLNHHKT